jgi:hypothetical protein
MGWSINEAPTTTTYLGYLSLDLDRAIKHSKELGCSVDFIATLQNLKQQLPEKSAFPAWKEQHPTVWRQQLRAAMIQYRNVVHDWQFDTTQQANLRKYCLANKLLREFLQAEDECYLISDNRQYIIDTFCRPIHLIPPPQIQTMICQIN